ncbi:cytolysin [Desarmillaria ectypa]|nr:cytolysin [Desarmillaria ectypa]
MAGPRTSWEDLSNLGWYKQQVYNTLNAQRGNTMQGLGDMALNEGFALDWSWYCYNVTKGDPYEVGHSVDTATKSTTVWSYDNTHNSKPYTTTWTESWSTTETASLSVTRSSTISLEWSVTIGSVAGSSFSFSATNETSKTQTKESTHTLENVWEITVGAGETLTILRTQLTTSGKSVYNLRYGLNDGGLIATKGKSYNGHYYWGFSANYYLNSPSGTIAFDGLSQSSSYSHQIIRNDGSQRASSSVIKLLKPTTDTLIGPKGRTVLQHAFPAENDGPPEDDQ